MTLGPGDPCTVAARQQLAYFRSGGFTPAVLRQLDRPGIVTLYDDAQRPVYALVTGLNAQSVTLRIDGAAQLITLASFESLWRGDYAAYWRTPPGYAGGDASGPLAPWLARQLARARGDATAGPVPDAVALKMQIQAFQANQALRVDGLAGPLTLMQLNRASGVDEPRLHGGEP